MTELSLSGIKFRAKSIGSIISDPSFTEFYVSTSTAIASVVSPTISLSTNKTIISVPATANASVTTPRLGQRTITSVPAISTASVSAIIVRISVTSIATSTASIVAPGIKISVTSVANATAGITAPTISNSSSGLTDAIMLEDSTGIELEGSSDYLIGE